MPKRQSLFGRLRGHRLTAAALRAAAEEEDEKARRAADEDPDAEDDEDPAAEDEEQGKKGKGRRAEDEPEDPDAEDDEDPAAEDDEKGKKGEDDEKMASPERIAQMCTDAGVPEMVGGLVREGVTLGELRARLGARSDIRKMVKLARTVDPTIGAGLADRFVKQGASPAEAGLALLGMLADGQSAPIRSAHQPGGQAVEASWDAAVKKVNAERKAF